MITLRFERLYQGMRKGEPCTAAIAVPKGKLTNTDRVIVSKDSWIYPSQAKVTGFWEDGSVRWLLIRFLADLPGNEETQYYLSLEGEVAGISADSQQMCVAESGLDTKAPGYEKRLLPCRRLTCTPDGQGFRVDNDVLRFAIDTGENTSFKFFTYEGVTYNAGNFYGPVLTEHSGKVCPFEMQTWTVSEAGPVAVRLNGTGFYRSGKNKYRFEMQLVVNAGLPMIDVTYHLINTSREPLQISSFVYGFHAPEAARKTYAAYSDLRTHLEAGENGEAVECLWNGEESYNSRNRYPSEAFYGAMFADCTTAHSGVCAVIFRPGQNAPKAVRADETGLELSFIPEGAAERKLNPGMSEQQRFLICFHNPDINPEELNTLSLIYQMPDRPWIAPEIYQEAGVIPDIIVKKTNLEAETAFLQGVDELAGRPVFCQMEADGTEHTNRLYEWPHACALFYLRTGTRRFLDYMLTGAKQLLDLSVGWYAGQVNSGVRSEHCCELMEGLMDYYHFTGEELFYKTAVRIGEEELQDIDIHNLLPLHMEEINTKKLVRAIRLFAGLYRETAEKQWLEKCDWIFGFFEQWEQNYGGWLTYYTDATLSREVLFISSAVGSLMEYYRVYPQERVKRLILHEVDGMIENCYLENGLFCYRDLPGLKYPQTDPVILEALAVACELTGKQEYLSYGEQTFYTIVHKRSPGTFRFLPLAVYYKAATECGLFSGRRL